MMQLAMEMMGQSLNGTGGRSRRLMAQSILRSWKKENERTP